NIIYSGPKNITTSGNVQKNFTINGGSFGIDAGFISGPFPGGSIVSLTSGFAGVFVGAKVAMLANASSALKRFFSGNRISSKAGLFNSAEGLLRNHFTGRRSTGHTFNSNRGTWVAGQTAFGGFHSNGDFGWIRLRFDNNAKGYPNSITAIDWAYNNTGAPIIAGDTGAPTATPEPGSLSLLALAAGATGILALRRRKKA